LRIANKQKRHEVFRLSGLDFHPEPAAWSAAGCMKESSRRIFPEPSSVAPPSLPVREARIDGEITDKICYKD
jgi:hypothetical protein